MHTDVRRKFVKCEVNSQRKISVPVFELGLGLEALMITLQLRFQMCYFGKKKLAYYNIFVSPKMQSFFLYIYIYIFTHTHTHMYIHIYGFIHIYLYTHIYIYIYICTHTYIYIYTHTCIHKSVLLV